eukprot:CAMPEP_0119068090 /NCGR_PEP_ID=MMETSP1178-20130426/10477_1 /TAXON_ID=33656 /ORGANISM="unid sp, Strain CCMP2000" /LENGTH=101 /DNA_ID=CAMNT_0007049783 /DNA_START=27 /DNA_END=329 /DNA_ORIENTATION=-
MTQSPPSTSTASPTQMKSRLETMLAYPFDCTLTLEAYEQCLSHYGHWSKCQAPRDALDSCVELGEKRRFRVETNCRRWKRLFQSCLLHGNGDEACEDRLRV